MFSIYDSCNWQIIPVQNIAMYQFIIPSEIYFGIIIWYNYVKPKFYSSSKTTIYSIWFKSLKLILEPSSQKISLDSVKL